MHQSHGPVVLETSLLRVSSLQASLGGRSVGGVAASTTAVAAAVGTSRRVASRRAIATTHGRRTVAAIGTTTTAARTTTAAAAVHAGKVGTLGDDLCCYLVSTAIPLLLQADRVDNTFKFLFLNTLSFSTSAWVTRLGSANST